MSLIYDNLRALHAQTTEDGPQRPGSASNRPPRRSRSLARRSPEAVMFSIVGVGLGLAAVVGVWWHWNAPGGTTESTASVAASTLPVAEAFSQPAIAMAATPVLELGRWPAEARAAMAAVPMEQSEQRVAAALADNPDDTPDETGSEPVTEAATAVAVAIEPTPAVTAAVTASAPSPADVNRLRNRLVMAIDSQDDDTVKATLAMLRDTLGEESVFYQRLQAFTWLRSQQWAKAEQAYDALLLQDGDDADARFNSGRLALRRGDLDKAEQRLRSLQRHPEYRQSVAAMLAELDRQQRHAQAGR